MDTRYGDAAMSNVTINAKIRYINLTHMNEGYRQLCIQKCGQTAAQCT